jgi:predicted class III extradiol MEMO1 family dioxygenase
MGAIRPPAVAGSFYSADAGRLRATIEDCLAAAGNSCAKGIPKAVIAPATSTPVRSLALLLPRSARTRCRSGVRW